MYKIIHKWCKNNLKDFVFLMNKKRYNSYICTIKDLLMSLPKVLIIGMIFFYSHSLISQDEKSFFLGHSLINFHTPNMVKRLSEHAGKEFNYNANIGVGASLSWHYTEPYTGEGDTWIDLLPSGGFDQFILTEAIPLQSQIEWGGTLEYMDSLYMYAQFYNPNIKMYIWETWHCIFSGLPSGCESWEWDNELNIPFETRLVQDLPLWESMMQSINIKYGANTAFLIPGGQALLALNDSIQSGNVPGINSLSDLFVDNIHCSYRGTYFMACVMYSVLQQSSPEGLPANLADPDGILYSLHNEQENPIPTTEQAAIFQRIAWNTVCAYNNAGFSCSSTSIDNEFPRSATEYLVTQLGDNFYSIDSPIAHNYMLLDVQGRVVMQGLLPQGNSQLNLSVLPQGYYILSSDLGVKKLCIITQ